MSQDPPAKPSATFGILVVDDHPMVRERLAEVIGRESDLTAIGEAEDRFQALQLTGELRPDLVIVDLTLRNSHGLELIKDLRNSHPDVKSLVVSMQEETLYAERCIRAGAHGYITKQEATRNILVAIRRVLNGEIYLSPTMATRIASNLLGRSRPDSRSNMDSLTDRELQVFEGIGAGLSTKQIAEKLHIDVKTIETYRARIKDKLSLKDGSELVRMATIWAIRLE